MNEINRHFETRNGAFVSVRGTEYTVLRDGGSVSGSASTFDAAIERARNIADARDETGVPNLFYA